MAKNQSKQDTIRKKRSETAATIADIAKVTPAFVRMVMNGDRENDQILNATIIYEQGKNQLIKHIEKIVPFN